MPKGTQKELTKLIPRVYKRNAENLMLFSWVNAQKQILPTITTEQAIWNYFKFCHIENWDMESAIATFFKINKEYIEDCKDET
jgi:hypothetical protein